MKWLRRWRERNDWIEAPTHDIGILPNGRVIHYSTCWCKQSKDKP